MESRAVLHLTRDMLGKSGLSTTATIWAEFHFGLVLGDVKADFWQIVNLPCQAVRDPHLFPACSTRTCPCERYRLDFVGLVAKFQRFSWVPWLSARRAFALLALTFGFPGRVFARWLIGVAAIQSEKGFDSPQFGLQCGDFSLEANHLDSKSFTVGTGLLRNALTLPASASQVPLLSSYLVR